MDRQQALKAHRDLESQGWQRRFSAQEPRLSEMKDLYESLGLEVTILDGGIPDDDQDCTGCFDLEGSNDLYKTIYTRGEITGEDSDDDTFD
jgi:hypothetical protein